MRRLLRPAVFVGIVAVVARVDPVLGVAALLAVWAATSWWLPPRALAGVSGERIAASRALFGESVRVELRLAAERRVPWLSVTDTRPFDLGPSARWVTAFDGGETRVHSTTFEATKRGLHRLGPAVVVTGDGFGMRRVQATLVGASTILVYPRIVSIETLTIAAGAPLPVIPTRTPLYDDPTRIVGVREYQAGDPIRRIHWTASAATGALLVKKHRPGIARNVVLALDLQSAAHPLPGRRRSAEIAVTAAASLVHHLMTVRRESVGVRIVGRDTPTGSETLVEVPPGRDDGRLARVLEQLARSDLSSLTESNALLDPAGLPFGASVVLITGVPHRGHVLAAMRLRHIGLTVSVVTTAGERHRSGWEDSFAEAGIPVRSVSRLAEMVDL